MVRKLTDYKVLTFDCYGTLIDWETGIWDAVQPLIAANGRQDIERSNVLREFADIETMQQRATPGLLYEHVLRLVHAKLAKRLDMRTTDELDAGFGTSLPSWPAFADSASSLRYLKNHFRMVILSNVSRAGIALSVRKLGVEFDAIYTAEDIGSYKPNPNNFKYLLDSLQRTFGFGPDDVLHTAQSLYHDHAPANEFGLANAWIDRQRLSAGGDWGATAPTSDIPRCQFQFFTMAEMANAVRRPDLTESV